MKDLEKLKITQDPSFSAVDSSYNAALTLLLNGGTSLVLYDEAVVKRLEALGLVQFDRTEGLCGTRYVARETQEV